MGEFILDGVRVLELGGGVATGFAGRWLAGFGADVVRAEWPGRDAELTADEAAYLVPGKRRVTVDSFEAVVALVADADIVIDGHAPGWLDIGSLRQSRPGLVWVSVTPFGWSGPYRDFQSTPIVSFAMGGIHSLTGDLNGEPLHSGGSQAFYLAGINAFACAVTAWFARLRHGAGAWFDLSMQELAVGMLELYLPGTAYGMPTQLRTGNHVRSCWGIYPCLDGWAGVFCLERQIPALFAVLDDPELDEERFRDPLQRYEPDNDEVMTAKLYGFFAGHTKAELLTIARERKIPIGVAMTPADLLASPGLAERGFFDRIDGATVPGRPFPGFGWRFAAPEGDVGKAAAAEEAVTGWSPRAQPAAPEPTAAHLPALPLAGVKVVDLTMMWAGPFATMRLADLGAEVWKIESPSAWDNIRTLVPQPGVVDPWNSAYYFNAYNRHKKSVTLDLAQPAGRELLLRLVAEADVLIENYRADVLDNLGLSWAVLQAANPKLVIVSMAAFGKQGVDASQVGFGPVIELMSGLASRTGYRDGGGEPFKTGISYGDPVGGTAAVSAVMLGLLQRDRTGRGAVVDLAQREVGSTLAGEAFVAASQRGEDPEHLGNRSARWAPQGVYRCAPSRTELGDARDEQWLALTVRSDREWAALCHLLGRADLADLDLAERFARHDELDGLIAAWTRGRDAQETMELFQRHGIPAGRVLDTGAALVDPHLQRRGFFVYPPHPRMFRHAQCAPGWRSVEAPGTVRAHAPLFGEHNQEILGDLLGVTGAELAALQDGHVIGDQPLNPGVG